MVCDTGSENVEVFAEHDDEYDSEYVDSAF